MTVRSSVYSGRVPLKKRWLPRKAVEGEEVAADDVEATAQENKGQDEADKSKK